MTILCCTANCNPAYAQTGLDKIEIIERLPDGSVILTINGAKFRAITPDQIRDIQVIKVNLESCTQTNSILTDKNEQLKIAISQTKQDAALASGERDNALKRGDEYKQQYEHERDLRESAEKLKIPKKPHPVVAILSNPTASGAIVSIFKKLIHSR